MDNPTTDIIYKDCPIRNILSHICGKWALLILYTLHHHGCMRFNSLHKHIPDISQKVLTSTLRSLEADGFVSRKIYAEVPPRVEYTLTERAQSFLPQAEGLIAWAQNNRLTSWPTGNATAWITLRPPSRRSKSAVKTT